MGLQDIFTTKLIIRTTIFETLFKCDIQELNEAVLAAKRFLSSIEEKVIRQRNREERDHPTSPQQLLK